MHILRLIGLGLLTIWALSILGFVAVLLKDWRRICADPFEELKEHLAQMQRITLASQLKETEARIRVDLLKGDQP